MTMEEYLREIGPAIEHLLPQLWREHEEFEELQSEVDRLRRAVVANYERVDAIANSDVPDDDGIATALYWDTYFGEDKEHLEKSGELIQLRARADAHSFAVAALAGTLL